MDVTAVRTSTSAASRIARGSLIIAVGYLLISVGRPLLLLAFGQADDGDFLTPAVAASIASQVAGVFVAVVFCGIAIGVLIVRSGLRLGAGPSVARSTWTDVALGGATIAATGYVLVAATGRVMLSGFTAALAETGADDAAQIAALHMGNVVAGAAAVMSGIGVVTLLAALATIGRRAGSLGGITAVVLWVACGILLCGFVGLAFLPVQFAVPIVFLAVGIVAARRARSAQA